MCQAVFNAQAVQRLVVALHRADSCGAAEAALAALLTIATCSRDEESTQQQALGSLTMTSALPSTLRATTASTGSHRANTHDAPSSASSSASIQHRSSAPPPAQQQQQQQQSMATTASTASVWRSGADERLIAAPEDGVGSTNRAMMAFEGVGAAVAIALKRFAHSSHRVRADGASILANLALIPARVDVW